MPIEYSHLIEGRSVVMGKKLSVREQTVLALLRQGRSIGQIFISG